MVRSTDTGPLEPCRDTLKPCGIAYRSRLAREMKALAALGIQEKVREIGAAEFLVGLQ